MISIYNTVKITFHRILCILAYLVVFIINPASGSGLDLKGCIKYAFMNNSEIKKSLLDFESYKQSVIQKRSIYETSLSASLLRTEANFSDTNPIYGSNSKNTELTLDFTKKLNTSALLTLGWDNKKSSTDSQFITINPIYESSLDISLVQPLYRNAWGNYDKIDIEASETAKAVMEQQIRAAMNNIVFQIRKAFYSLCFAYKNLESQKRSLERTKKLHNINLSKLKDGLVEEVDVISTEAAIILKEAAILKAESLLRDSEEHLKTLIGISDFSSYSFDIDISTDVNPEKVNADSLFNRAIIKRPEIIILKTKIASESLQRRLKSENLKPDINLVTGFGLSNSGSEFFDNYSSILKAENPNWRIGLTFNMKPYNILNKSLLKQQDINNRKSMEDLSSTKIKIKSECNAAARNINSQIEYLEASKRSALLQKKKLELEEIKFNQGRSSINWILSFQDELNNAEIEFFKALTDYYISAADEALVTGEDY